MNYILGPELLDMDPDELEHQLGMQAGAGDLSSFDTVYGLYYDRLKNLISYRFHDRPPAEDIAQDTFTKAYEAIEARKFSYQGPHSLFGWLTRIAFNRAIDFRRRDSRITMTPVDFQDADYLHPITPDFTDDIATADAAECMLRLVRPDFAEVIRAIDLDGDSYGEYADDSGINLGTVRSRLHRGRNALRESLEPPEPTE